MPACLPPLLFRRLQRLKEMVLKWLPVTNNKAIDGEAPLVGDSPIKTGALQERLSPLAPPCFRFLDL